MAQTIENYQAPLADMQFLVKAFSSEFDSDHFFILEQAAKFSEEQLAPINATVDITGCQFRDGEVYLPEPLKKAFSIYAAAGWMGLSMPEAFGGQDLPQWLAASVSELLTSSNHAFSMMPALTMSACKALINHGSDTLKATYLPNMIGGRWTGTMCLTEAHCGSDLGLVRTRAKKITDQVYHIKGEKIFISSGQHDASENIIHLVLARAEDAPKGIKGLSLFLVPAKLKNKDHWDKPNAVTCIGIEEKMGIHGNPTCAMSFDNAEGYLVGDLNKGINAMFTMMNEMRLGTAIQGIGLCERAFQKSFAYAKDRTQMRSLSGIKSPEQDADRIIHHPDVRRMLLTQKVFAEGGRALAQYCATLMQREHDQTASENDKLVLNMLTPIAKGFCTEVGLEAASNAIQIYGGHGFITESGVEQLYRDGRIATLYEGTTGIQALDLLGRKVLGTQGKSLLAFTKEIHLFCKQHLSGKQQTNSQLSPLIDKLHTYSKEWPELTMALGKKAIKDRDEVGAASVDYLMYCGYVTLAYMWARMAVKADALLAADTAESTTFSTELLRAKCANAKFYFERILPRASAHKNAMFAGGDSLMDAAGLAI